MDILEAYATALAAIEKLQLQGIFITVVPSKAALDPHLVAKYADRLPADKWHHIRFFPANDEQAQAIADARKALGWQGITFDSGGPIPEVEKIFGAGERNWELDWSLRIKEHQ